MRPQTTLRGTMEETKLENLTRRPRKPSTRPAGSGMGSLGKSTPAKAEGRPGGDQVPLAATIFLKGWPQFRLKPIISSPRHQRHVTLRALLTARPAWSSQERRESWFEAPHHKIPATAPERFPRGVRRESAAPPTSTPSREPRPRRRAARSPPPRHLGTLGAGSGPEPPRPHRARGATPGRRAGTKGAAEGPRPSGREGGVSGRARARGGRGRPGQSARRESPRTRAKTARSARGRARARRPYTARGDHTGRRKGQKTLQGRRVRAKPGREARRAARPPRAHGTGLVGTGNGQGSARPPPPPDPRRLAPPAAPSRAAPAPQAGGKGGNRAAPRGPGWRRSGAPRPSPRGGRGGDEKETGAREGQGVERMSTTHPSIAHTGDPRGTEWRRRNSRNRPNGSEL